MGGSGGSQGVHGSRSNGFAARAKAFGLKKYHETSAGGIKYVTTVAKDGRVSVTAYAADGQQVGHAAFRPKDSKTLYPGDVHVEKDFRRRGIATKMYDLAKKQSGAKKIVEAIDQQPDGKAFRKKYKG